MDNEYKPSLNDNDFAKAQQKLAERKALRGRGISTGLLCLICVFTFYLLANAVSEIMAQAYSNTALLNDSNFSLIPNMLLNGFISLVGLGLTSVIFCRITKTDMNEILPGEKVPFKKLIGVVAAGTAVCLCANYLSQLFLLDLSIFGLKTTYDAASMGSTGIWEHISYILTVSVVPAVSEEMLFRGCVMGRLRKFGDGFALVASAILFGAIHGNLTQFPFAFIVGLAVGWTVIYTNSIIPAMIIHGLNNLISVISDILYENLELAGIDTMYAEFAIIALFLAVFIFALISTHKLSKSDKNFGKFSSYSGELSFKERIKVFFTSATVIIFLAVMLLECILTLAVIE